MNVKLPCYVHPEFEDANKHGQPQTWYWVRQEDHYPLARCADRSVAVRIRNLLNHKECE